MIDPAKLDEIERATLAVFGEAVELVRGYRQAIAYRALIDAHNAARIAECGDTAVPGGEYRRCTGGLLGGNLLRHSRRCEDCPQHYMIIIDLPADDAPHGRSITK